MYGEAQVVGPDQPIPAYWPHSVWVAPLAVVVVVLIVVIVVVFIVVDAEAVVMVVFVVFLDVEVEVVVVVVALELELETCLGASPVDLAALARQIILANPYSYIFRGLFMCGIYEVSVPSEST